MVAEPVGAICGGPPIHRDHQVAIQQNLGGGVEWGREADTEHGVMSCTLHPKARQLQWGLKAEDPIGTRHQLARAAAPELSAGL